MKNNIKKLIEKEKELKKSLLEIQVRIKKNRIKCKHQMISTGTDSQFFYSECSECGLSIRYNHNFSEVDLEYYTEFQKIKGKIINILEYFETYF